MDGRALLYIIVMVLLLAVFGFLIFGALRPSVKERQEEPKRRMMDD